MRARPLDLRFRLARLACGFRSRGGSSSSSSTVLRRGDGFFGIDLGVGKRFSLYSIKDQPHTIQFRAESFNITNSVRFDPYSANQNILNPARFGQYTTTLTKPRVFQFSLRYEF